MMFFLSDTHAFHNKMLDLRSQHKDSLEMTQFMAEQINSTVGKKDTLVHAGDWSFGSVDQAVEFRNMLKCKDIWLAKGNHDQRFARNKKFRGLFSRLEDVYMIHKDKISVCVFHYPIESWPSKRYGTLHVHGHCHSAIGPMKNRYNACVDVNGYVPISLQLLAEKLKEEKHESPNTSDPDV